MATPTGRLIVHPKTGKMVEEMKEDQMMVALYEPNCASHSDYTFQRVLRSDFKLSRINTLFNCNAALLKDPFGNVIWPKDWMTQVLPPSGKDKWFYIIHERLEPPPQDDLKDTMYAGGTVLVLTSVPKECEAIDLQTWLLFGITQEYEPLVRVREQIKAAQRKRAAIKQKMAALPSMDVDGTPEQQAEMRKKLSDAMASHSSKYDDEIASLGKRAARIEKLLMTEPLKLSPLPIDKPLIASNDKNESMDQYEKRSETRSWTIAFQSPRGNDLITVALAKSDWNYVCLVQTRPSPRAFIEDDQVQNQIVSEKDMKKEINMRAVRLKRLRHGDGVRLLLNEEAQSEEEEKQLDPWDESFHISSIGAMYAGEWRMGEKHGKGKEVTNVGVYDGDFQRGYREGQAKFVYGKGTTVNGTFERRPRQYQYSTKCREALYQPSLLNGDQFRDGVEHGEHMKLTFPDGATYEGEMVDGRITGWGTYTSSTGVVDQGSFKDGLLHGDHCTRRFPDGAVQRGRFKLGQLHGRGELRERNGDEYDGYFEGGVKSGRGTSYFDMRRCKHTGFWFENMMDGRGDCYIQQSERVKRENTSGTQGDGENEDEDWDYWYEGSFIHGETQARHRFVDLKKCHRHHSPFTTNSKSVEKMPYLTLVLPQQLAKLEKRRLKNSHRRWTREKEYLQTEETKNLTMYYALLDEYYEKWVTKQREVKEEEGLASDQIDALRQERAAAIEYAENRLKFRKEKYDLSPRKKELAAFESYLERVTLSERVELERARAWEAGLLSPRTSK